MKDIIIVGAGGYGRDVLSLIEFINKSEPQWNILGFLSDDLHALDNVKCKYSIIGTIDDWKTSSNEHYALGVANPNTKRIIVEKMKRKGITFETLITPDSVICDFVKLGEGCLVWGANIGDNCVLGNFVHALGYPAVGQEVSIGSFSTLGFGCNIAHGYLGEGVFVGSNSVILSDKGVGDGATVGAGSVVVSRVRPGTTVMGNPAKKI